MLVVSARCTVENDAQGAAGKRDGVPGREALIQQMLPTMPARKQATRNCDQSIGECWVYDK